MRFLFTILFSLQLVIVPLFVFAEVSSQNIGLVERTIWYSKDPFFEGDTVKIYTILYNSASSPVSGTVEFYNGKIVLGKKEITVPAESPKDVFVTWQVSAGEHSISAKFLDTSILVNGKKQPITVENNVSDESKVFVPKKILSESKTVADQKNNTVDSGDTIVDKLADSASPYTPEPVKAVVETIDDYRAQKGEDFTVAKNETSKNIDQLKSETIEKNNFVVPMTNMSVNLDKPLAYVSLFFWTLLAFNISHKVVFYGLILVVFVLIIRFIWKRFHK